MPSSVNNKSRLASTKVLRYLADSDAAIDLFCGVLSGFDESKWDVPEAEGHWSLRQLVSHVAANTRFHAELARSFIDGTPPPTGRRDTRLPYQIERDEAIAGGVEPAVVWIRADHSKFRASLESVRDDQLAIKGETKLGVITVEYLFRRLTTHPKQHAKQAKRIRQAVGG